MVPSVAVVKKYRVFAVHPVSVTVTTPRTIAPLTPWRMFLTAVPTPSVKPVVSIVARNVPPVVKPMLSAPMRYIPVFVSLSKV